MNRQNKITLGRILRNLSNTQLANLVLAAVFSLMVVTMIPQFAPYIALAVVVVGAGFFSHDFAKAIDWMDDNVDFKVEIPWSYHFVYSLAISAASGFLVGYIGSQLVAFPPELYAAVSPRLVFFGLGFVSAFIGYVICWRTIPNNKRRGQS